MSQEFDSLRISPSIISSELDTVIRADSTLYDSIVQPIRKSDIETTINYTAQDSIRFNSQTQEVFMFGDTYIDYGEITLEAERIDVNWNIRTIHASYITDTTGKAIGKPVYSDGSDIYGTDEIIYNFKNRRALIKGVVTQKDEAFMHGKDVKKNSEDELFIKQASYTTCNLAEPHFEIRSSQLKVIPGNKVISGPFNLRFGDLPTPLFFPFGMFPQPKKKVSGIIFPSYGEETRRGFFLRNGGYYFAINDYVDARISGDIYSKGSNSVNFTSNYYKRYVARGTLNFSYSKSISDDIENPIETNDYWLRYNHNPQSKGSSSISASISAGTSSYNSNNNLLNEDFSRSINSSFTSNVSYRNSLPRTPFNMSLNLRHNQNLQTKIVNLTTPDFTLNMNRIYPLKNVVKSSRSPLAKLNFSHNFSSKFEINNNKIRMPSRIEISNSNPLADSIIPFKEENFDIILARSKFGGQHNIPISTSVTLLKYFTLSPSFNYRELWYMRELQYTYLPEVNKVRIDTLQGFSRAGSWSSGASLNTRIFGSIFFKKGKIKAIRHVMTPSVSFSYRPDFSSTKYGVYKEVQTDEDGATTTLSKYEGFLFGSPQGSESKTLGFSLTNNLEMKIASKKDTITGVEKIKIFDNLGMSSGYNIAADSFKLGNINLNARTSFFEGKISLNFTGTIDPYEYILLSESIRSDGSRNVSQRRVDRYSWNAGNGLGNFSNMNVSISMNFRPKVNRVTQNRVQSGTASLMYLSKAMGYYLLMIM